MYSLLIAIIYMAFISLGLPDSLLGAAWPVMQGDLQVPLAYAGVITTIISCGTILSSLLSHRLTRRLSAGAVTAISVTATAAALFGFSLANSFWQLCLWAVPYGLGAGAVDAALNNYVALHLSSRHMSWIHGFWGVGASVSPYIMGFAMSGQGGWPMGYRIIGIIQIVLSCLLFLSLPLWKRDTDTAEETPARALSIRQALAIPGVPYSLITYFSFCALETAAGLWVCTYLVDVRGIDPETAAQFAALFYIGETAARFLNGLVADRFGNKAMIRVGSLLSLVGVLLILIPTAVDAIPLTGLMITGFGLAPIAPCTLHATPANFGRENSQALVGIQMAAAYTGCTLSPPVFGLIAQHVTVSLYPVYLLVFAVIMLAASERLNVIMKRKTT